MKVIPNISYLKNSDYSIRLVWETDFEELVIKQIFKDNKDGISNNYVLGLHYENCIILNQVDDKLNNEILTTIKKYNLKTERRKGKMRTIKVKNVSILAKLGNKEIDFEIRTTKDSAQGFTLLIDGIKWIDVKLEGNELKDGKRYNNKKPLFSINETKN